MRSKLRSRLSFANVTSLLALFVALGTGGAYASHELINGSDVVNESLTGADVRGKGGTSSTAAVNGTITGHDVSGQRANASNKTPFAEGSLTGDDVRGSEGTNERAPVNGSLTGADISGQSGDRFKGIPHVDGSLTTWDIKDSTLSGNDLADGSVASPQVADETLTGDDIIEPSLGKVGDADTLDGKDSTDFLGATAKAADADKLDGQDSTAFGGPTDAFSAPPKFGSNSVFLDDVAPPETVLSKAVPAGTYLLLGKVTVQTQTSNPSTHLFCKLEPGTLAGGSLGSDFSHQFIEAGTRATLPLAATVTFSSPTTVTLSCEVGQGAGSAFMSQLIALRVDSIK